ncbi:MAG: hypothetical protein RL095_1599 [Verrucomicrobiota bacterium]|jgi:twitching motility protein PilT
MRIHDLIQKTLGLESRELVVIADAAPSVRIQGALEELPGEDQVLDADIRNFVTVALHPMQMSHLEKYRCLDLSWRHQDRYWRLVFGSEGGRFTLTASLLPDGNGLSLDGLGVMPGVLSLRSQESGLILLAGANGSGRTTLLHAFLSDANRSRNAFLVSLETPIEFVHRSRRARVSQREVPADALDMLSGFRNSLLAGADAIYLGELDGEELLRASLEASLAGKLVIACVNTIGARNTLESLLSTLPAESRSGFALDLSLVLRGIVTSRLVPRQDGEGSLYAQEVFLNTAATAPLIRQQRFEGLRELMVSGIDGMCTMEASMIKLRQEDRIRSSDVLSTTSVDCPVSPLVLASFNGDSLGLHPANDAIHDLLLAAIDNCATDLILSQDACPLLRICGRLHEIEGRCLNSRDLWQCVGSLLNSQQLQTFRREGEISIALSLDCAGLARRIRFSAILQRGTPTLSLRLVSDQLPSAAALKLPECLLDWCDRSSGLLLITGPTGHGKSSTLAALLGHIISRRPVHVVTIEDPVEHLLPNGKAIVDQREVGSDTPSIAAGIISSLRCSPEVIAVSSLPDTQSIAALLSAAETGQLVLACLPVATPFQALHRIIESFPLHQQNQVRQQLAACLVGIVSQRLTPEVEGRGRTPHFEILHGSADVKAQIGEGRMQNLSRLCEHF